MELTNALKQEKIAANSLSPLARWEENGVLHLEVPGDKAYDVWEKLRRLASDTGYWRRNQTENIARYVTDSDQWGFWWD